MLLGMNRSKYLLVFIVAFIGGIVAFALLLESLYWQFLLLVVCGMSVFVSFVRKFECKFLIMILLVFVGVVFGALRLYFSLDIGDTDIGLFDGQVEVYGCISEEVDVREDKVKYVLSVEKIKEDPQLLNVTGNLLVTMKRYPVYEFGDCMWIVGEVEKPGKIEDFDYGNYLSRYGITAVMYQGKLIEYFPVERRGFFGGIFSVKNVFELRMANVFAEPHASFMAGLVLGSRKGIPEALMADFNTTGLTHIIAISGYNITLLIVIVGGALSFMGRKGKVICATIVIIVFVILVGASAAVVRAGIMGVIGLVALWYGRNYAVSLALFFSAFLMNLVNPKIILYDVGFQLSFLATAGLIYVVPHIEKYFTFLPDFLGIRESVLMTMAAQILALPVILFNFGRLSLISPVANLFVLPFIPLAMVFGFFSTVLGFVSMPVAKIVGFGGYLILEIIIFLVELFAAVPLAAIDLQWFNWALFGLYYFFLLKFLIKRLS